MPYYYQLPGAVVLVDEYRLHSMGGYFPQQIREPGALGKFTYRKHTRQVWVAQETNTKLE